MKKIYFFFLICFFSLNLFAKETVLKIASSNKYGQEIEMFFEDIRDKFSIINKYKPHEISQVGVAKIDNVIQLLIKFLEENSKGELSSRARYMLGECYQLKAYSVYFSKGDKGLYHELLNMSLEEYSKAEDNRDLSDFFVQNLQYRIAEIYFALGEFKTSFDLVDKYPYNYLSSDVFYLLAVIYVNLLSESQINQASWSTVKDVLDDIKFKKGIEDKFAVASGITSFAMESYDRAINYFRSYESEDTKYFLGKSYQNLNQFIFAIGEYRYLLNKFPNSKYSEQALISIADCLYESAKYQFAITTYQEHLRDYPRTKYKAYILYKIALSYYEQKQYVKAIEYFGLVDKAYNVESSEIRELRMYSQYLKAYCYYHMQKYEKAALDFTECSKFFFEEYEGIKAVLMAANCNYKLKKYAKAEKILKDRLATLLIEDKLYLDMYYLMANCQYDSGRVDESILSYKTLVNKIKDEQFFDLRDRAFFMLNFVVYEQKNYKRIVTEFQYLLYKIHPGINRSDIRVKTYFLIADACYKLKYYNEAKVLFTQIAKEYIQNDIIYAKALDGLAWCDFKEQNYHSASRQRAIISDIIESTNENLGDLKFSNYYELGNIYFNTKDYMKAIENYEYYLEEAGDTLLSPTVLFRLGSCYYREEYYSVAIDKWQELVDKYSKDEKALEAIYKIADTYYKSGIYDKAIASYRELVASFDKKLPKVIESALRIPQSYFNAKEYDNAILEFKNFVLLYPKTEKIKETVDLIEATIYRKQEYEAYLQGQEIVEINIAEEMEKTLKTFIEEHINLPVITDIIFRLSKTYFEEGNYQKSLEWSNKLLTLGNYSLFDKEKIMQVQYYLAEAYYNLQEYTKAVKEYKNLIKNFVDFKSMDKVYIKLGTAYLNMENYREAINFYELLLKEFTETEYKEIVFYNLGISYKELGDITKANKAFIDYYKLDPNKESSQQLMLEVGDLYIKKRDYVNAILIYTKVYPSLNDIQKIYAQYKIAEAYDKQFDIEMSLQEYRKLMAMSPENDDVRLSGLIRFAEILQAQKIYKEAIDVYTHIVAVTDNEDWRDVLNGRVEELKSLLNE
ncbi:MAG: tetratricopeptide repeat protein [bacterium]|nr:tetratricopeptide repeat protein [bacterium]